MTDQSVNGLAGYVNAVMRGASHDPCISIQGWSGKNIEVAYKYSCLISCLLSSNKSNILGVMMKSSAMPAKEKAVEKRVFSSIL